MAVCYRTEFSLGRRGQICRRYTGVQALVAISVNLVLALVFGLVGFALRIVRFALRLIRHILIACFELIRALMLVPFIVARRVSQAFDRGARVRKPAWVPLDDLA